ncbi:MAG TPA: acetyl/propionyl/methylcrotonyl-CoA carboxylase subunit alpha [Plasticicumulans sp.]|nr:acetyl/propionyl/methylcrotonyl-CoA carboxylase subunit alpha [Plasticicumulans sp.]
MFDKILIANRGEIACRVIASCRRLGIRSVAVYSDADAQALHVGLADEAVRIGPAKAADSYLCAARIVGAALASGAQAVHPGYGFLSENAAFAEAVEAAGLVFIGPPPAAIRAMGSKSAAKVRMAQAGVPVVPGYHGEDQSLERLTAEAIATGFPLLLKPSAGGGGKGMKVVTHAGELGAQIESARREAAASFGDEQLLIERYLERPRHIEIQIFADAHGRCVSLFERDCSLQRRHQKVIEEAPAPGLDPARRQAMGEAACTAALAIGYRGAGTVEFIAEHEEAGDGRFFFMEMNTRLQVEHPVTEMITGLDLVEWQLRVAAGEPLPLAQAQIPLHGHAIEARIYAEDPARDFLPASGRLVHLHWPAGDAHVRIDTGVRQGDAVTPHYDPLLAKLIVHDEDRPRALARLRRALADCRIVGVANNLRFLAALAAHPGYAAGAVHTGFIADQRATLLPAPATAPMRVLALATLGRLLKAARDAARRAAASAEPDSPWQHGDGWRLNEDNHQVLRYRDGDDGPVQAVIAHYRPGHWRLELPDGSTATVAGRLDDEDVVHAEIDGRRTRATLVRTGAQLHVLGLDGAWTLTLHDPLAQAMAGEAAGAGRLSAPMPGTVVAVRVAPGEAVEAGQVLLILEAMKMEHTLRAPRAGTVASIACTVGETVTEGTELLKLAGEEEG